MKKLLALAGIIAAFSVGINTNTAFAAGTQTDTYIINFTINNVTIDIPDATASWTVNAEEHVDPGTLAIPAVPDPPSLFLQTDIDYLQSSQTTVGTDNTIPMTLSASAGAVPVNLYAQVTGQTNASDIGVGAAQSQLRVDLAASPRGAVSRTAANYLPAVSVTTGAFSLITAASEFNATLAGDALDLTNWLHTQDAPSAPATPSTATITVFIAAQ